MGNKKSRNRQGLQHNRSGTGDRARNAAWGALAVAATGALVAVILLLPAGDAAVASAIEFTDVKVQSRQFMEYYHSIELDAAQEAVKQEALSGLPAPCCSDRSAYTCCCQCNMAKTWWGLSHHLIAEEGLGAEDVRAAVSEWFEFINPSGFSGNACYTGGCSRPFHRNGCGGMDASNVVF